MLRYQTLARACALGKKVMAVIAQIPSNRYLIAAASICCIALTAPAAAKDQVFLTLATGGVTGVYHPAGTAICRAVNESRSEHGVRCAAEAGRGSVGSLKQLRNRDVDFAIVQADWQHHAYLGTSVFAEFGPMADLRVVAGLHTEMAAIVVRADSGFMDISDLKGQRINIGPAGSGSAATWGQLSQHLPWSEEDRAAITQEDLSGLGEALCSGEIDAYFVVIGHPAGVIEETQEVCPVRFIEIGAGISEKMVADAAYYRAAEIPSGAYGEHNAIETIGTRALLVTVEQMPAHAVSTVLKSLLSDIERFRTVHPALTDLDGAQLFEAKTEAPLHLGAVQFYQDQGYLP
ncbi:TAXI family TRAP transporter solute-binding subunit [Roseibium sp.]|uniref:TAXI family TRAP transporter solute-binding subunit n=1 Tax=Roseibium sp. TaxID=1936156 RepID=UPI003D09B08A